MPHITFIHGISNKPEEKKLLKIWQDALAQDQLGNDDGIDLGANGVTTSMIQWADVLYDKLDEGTIHESASGFESTESVAVQEGEDPDMSWREKITGEELSKKYLPEHVANEIQRKKKKLIK